MIAGLEAAAVHGGTDAEFQLALVRDFLGGEDQARAVATFERLAEAGHVHAISMTALAYRSGWSVPVDYERSAYWLERAAALGDEQAARDLAAYQAYRESEGEQ